MNESTLAESRLYNRVTRRVIPLLFCCYVAAYLDRVNVGFAKLQMLNDLRFSETVYGLGAGIFFIGYFLFEIPSNIILHRIGARLWIARVMLTWAVVSAAMMFVTTPTVFYVLRFLLGVAEAGFFPGVILYLTYWYPSYRRARIIALFMTGIPVAGVIGGPISGWVLKVMTGAYGLAGWQWLFLIEALPSLILGAAVFVYLDDGIAGARWLAAEQKEFLARRITEDQQQVSSHSLREIYGERPSLAAECDLFLPDRRPLRRRLLAPYADQADRGREPARDRHAHCCAQRRCRGRNDRNQPALGQDARAPVASRHSRADRRGRLARHGPLWCRHRHCRVRHVFGARRGHDVARAVLVPADRNACRRGRGDWHCPDQLDR